MKLPSRKLYDAGALDAVKEVFEYAEESGRDFGYQGVFEDRYTQAFCEFLGDDGFADAVNSGSNGIYIAIKALELSETANVVVSPVTDPGGVCGAVVAGHSISIADSAADSYNMSAETFLAAVTPETEAVIVTHMGGLPAEIDEIVEAAGARNIKVVEDCSQAHGAEYKGRKVGTFGDISVFSTMFCKNHGSGGCGGLVYTKSEDLYKKIRSYADRGKNFFADDYDPKDSSKNLFPSLNFNQDEVSCALGAYTLKKLPAIIKKRKELVDYLSAILLEKTSLIPHLTSDMNEPSYFFFTISAKNAEYDKYELTDHLISSDLWINPEYKFVVSQWPWLSKHIKGNAEAVNAEEFQQCSFNLLFHENFSFEDMDCIADAIIAFEKKYLVDSSCPA